MLVPSRVLTCLIQKASPLNSVPPRTIPPGLFDGRTCATHLYAAPCHPGRLALHRTGLKRTRPQGDGTLQYGHWLPTPPHSETTTFPAARGNQLRELCVKVGVELFPGHEALTARR